MSKLPIQGADLDVNDLLPLEEEVEANGVTMMKRIKYPAEVTSSMITTSKGTGNQMLELVLGIQHPNGNRVYIKDYYSFSVKARFKLKGLVELANLERENLDTDDFFGLWFLVTIAHEEFKGGTMDEDTGEFPVFKSNKIAKYIKLLSAEELKALQESGQVTPTPTQEQSPF